MLGAIPTEELIKETAKKVFFQQGHLKATTQEIADAAGVNRALIHYYFRSRNLLFDKVLQEAMSGFMHKVLSVLEAEVPFKEKIKVFIQTFIGISAEFPYLQNFIVTEMVKQPEKMTVFHPQHLDEVAKKLNEELAQEIKNNTVAPTTLEHFIVNIMSLCSYPFIAQPIIQTIFSLNQATYQEFLQERKEIIFKIIFKEKS
ncbi:MAG: TetR family transcriptional regulator [Cytophagales bacterium CG18_big_fil_WC_8_21_14_2_50_42_9]|nr:MAG: TetR family transcriptional regulator [Cytophagales bacterium CG18_big_fil_WC_8_21_14_2_50_42_9]